MDPEYNLYLQSLGLIASIVIAIVFAFTVKNNIKKKAEFSGVSWGILNGIVGVGILWVIIAHSSINKEIEKIKNKKYKSYAEAQMKDFIKAYGTCLLIWIVIIFITSMV